MTLSFLGTIRVSAIVATQHFAYRVVRKTARGEETHLLGAICARGGGLAEFALPDLPGAIDFGRLRLCRNAFDRFVGNAFGAQVVANARDAEFARERVGARFGHPVLGQELSPDELVEQEFEGFGRFGVLGEFPDELGATVIAPHEQPERAGLQLAWSIRPALLLSVAHFRARVHPWPRLRPATDTTTSSGASSTSF